MTAAAWAAKELAPYIHPRLATIQARAGGSSHEVGALEAPGGAVGRTVQRHSKNLDERIQGLSRATITSVPVPHCWRQPDTRFSDQSSTSTVMERCPVLMTRGASSITSPLSI